MTFDYAAFIRLRINEHVVHTWDVAVVFDRAAPLEPDAAAVVLEAVPMIARYAGKPTGSTKQLRVRTVAPDRHFAVSLFANGISLAPDDGAGPPDLELPGEAFVRLVYGRLDSEHTPDFEGADGHLAELRRAFPGV